jgi:hypothetical protein
VIQVILVASLQRVSRNVEYYTMKYEQREESLEAPRRVSRRTSKHNREQHIQDLDGMISWEHRKSKRNKIHATMHLLCLLDFSFFGGGFTADSNTINIVRKRTVRQEELTNGTNGFVKNGL